MRCGVAWRFMAVCSIGLLAACAPDGPGPIPFAVGNQGPARIGSVTARVNMPTVNMPMPTDSTGAISGPSRGPSSDQAFPAENLTPSDSPNGAFFGAGQRNFYGYN